jgi:hypothetical protein
MKKNSRRFLLLFPALVVGFAISLGTASLARAQNESGPLQEQMTPEEFKAAGLNKLTPEELARLNSWIQGNREQAVTAAVKNTRKKAAEEAERDKRSLIVSRYDGVWSGIGPGEIIQLEDGSKWKLANKDEHYQGHADHPAIAVWKAGFFGWKMRVSRIAEFYVNPVK